MAELGLLGHLPVARKVAQSQWLLLLLLLLLLTLPGWLLLRQTKLLPSFPIVPGSD